MKYQNSMTHKMSLVLMGGGYFFGIKILGIAKNEQKDYAEQNTKCIIE